MPVYLFWGDEDFTLENEIRSIKDEVLGGGNSTDIEISPLNYRCLDNPDFKALIDALRAQPMMFGDIVYKIRADKYFLETTKKVKLDDKQTDEVIKALDLVSERVHIALTCPIEKGDRKKPDSRKKLYKAVQKVGSIKEFTAFKAYEEYKILPVLKTMVQKAGLKADNSVLTLIIREVGPSLRDLNTALEKIKLIIHPEKIITENAVKEAGGEGRNVFLINDLILDGKYTEAVFEISKMLDKSHYLEILAFLQSSFSKLLMTKVYSNSMSSFDIARKTGQNEYAVKKSLEKLGKISLNELVRIKQGLTEAEYKIKSGAAEPLLAFECALLDKSFGKTLSDSTLDETGGAL